MSDLGAYGIAGIETGDPYRNLAAAVIDRALRDATTRGYRRREARAWLKRGAHPWLDYLAVTKTADDLMELVLEVLAE